MKKTKNGCLLFVLLLLGSVLVIKAHDDCDEDGEMTRVTLQALTAEQMTVEFTLDNTLAPIRDLVWVDPWWWHMDLWDWLLGFDVRLDPVVDLTPFDIDFDFGVDLSNVGLMSLTAVFDDPDREMSMGGAKLGDRFETFIIFEKNSLAELERLPNAELFTKSAIGAAVSFPNDGETQTMFFGRESIRAVSVQDRPVIDVKIDATVRNSKLDGIKKGDDVSLSFMLDTSLVPVDDDDDDTFRFIDPWRLIFWWRDILWDVLRDFEVVTNLGKEEDVMLVSAVFDNKETDRVMGLELGSSFNAELVFEAGTLFPGQLPGSSAFPCKSGTIFINNEAGDRLMTADLNGATTEPGTEPMVEANLQAKSETGAVLDVKMEMDTNLRATTIVDSEVPRIIDPWQIVIRGPIIPEIDPIGPVKLCFDGFEAFIQNNAIRDILFIQTTAVQLSNKRQSAPRLVLAELTLEFERGTLTDRLPQASAFPCLGGVLALVDASTGEQVFRGDVFDGHAHDIAKINVNPGDNIGLINTAKPDSLVSVALLSTPFFNAQLVDESSVCFGPMNARAVESTGMDLNADGRQDLLLQFRTGNTGINNANIDQEAELSGRLFDGTNFAASAEVTNCPNPGENVFVANRRNIEIKSEQSPDTSDVSKSDVSKSAIFR